MVTSNSVFISYRREVGFAWAQLAWEDLTSHDIDVFLDLETLQDAGAFDEKILNQIAARPYFVPVLALGSLERCVNSGDWLRREVEHAVSIGRAVVPLIVAGFDFAEADRCLPAHLARALRNSNGVGFVPEYYREGLRRLREDRLKPVDLPVLTPSHEDLRFAAEAETRARQATTEVQRIDASGDRRTDDPTQDRSGAVAPTVPRRGRLIAAVAASLIFVLGGVLVAVAFVDDDGPSADPIGGPDPDPGVTMTSSSSTTTTTTSSTVPPDTFLGATLGPDRHLDERFGEEFVMRSTDGGHTLSMTGAGALQASTYGVPWGSQPAADNGEPIPGGETWAMQRDGNFVLYAAGNVAIWSSQTADYSRFERGDAIELEIFDDDGVGVLEVRVNGERVWAHRADQYLHDGGSETDPTAVATTTSAPDPPTTSTDPTTTTEASTQVRVPPLVGLSERQARQSLDNVGLLADVRSQTVEPGSPASGTVVEQSVPPMQEVDRGSIIAIVVATSSE